MICGHPQIPQPRLARSRLQLFHDGDGGEAVLEAVQFLVIARLVRIDMGVHECEQFVLDAARAVCRHRLSL